MHAPGTPLRHLLAKNALTRTANNGLLLPENRVGLSIREVNKNLGTNEKRRLAVLAAEVPKKREGLQAVSALQHL